jgi:outer membrane protein W
MKKHFIILLAVFCAAALQSTAQKGKNIFGFSWEIGLPSNDYISKTSFSGGRIEYRKMISSQFSAGLAFGWNSFEEYSPAKTYSSPDGASAVTTDMVKQIYIAPVTALFHYYPKVSGKIFKPYVGVGAGTSYSEQYSYFNIYQIDNNNWGFVVRPEIGTFIKFQSGFGAMVGASYQYSTNQNPDFRIKSLSQFSINIGLTWAYD